MSIKASKKDYEDFRANQRGNPSNKQSAAMFMLGALARAEKLSQADRMQEAEEVFDDMREVAEGPIADDTTAVWLMQIATSLYKGYAARGEGSQAIKALERAKNAWSRTSKTQSIEDGKRLLTTMSRELIRLLHGSGDEKGALKVTALISAVHGKAAGFAALEKQIERQQGRSK